MDGRIHWEDDVLTAAKSLARREGRTLDEATSDLAQRGQLDG